jgi:ribosomal protein S7
MNRGLKLRAFNFFLKIKKELKVREDFDPSFVFLISMINITPSLMIKHVERRGVLYKIPFPVLYWKKIILSCT